LEPLTVIERRLHQQRLAGDPFATPKAVVRGLGAMQAQEFAEAKFSIAERTPGCTDAGVEAAFARGDILRTHVLRPTWHFVAPEDIRWMLSLTAPRVQKAAAYSYRQAGLDARELARGDRRIVRALSDGEPRTRAELGSVLGGPAGALSHRMMHAELGGLVVSGPRRGKQHTYALLEARAPGARDLPREEALAELTRRYFTGHGPATVRDFAWWSGLTVTDIRAALAALGDALVCESDDDGRAWYSAPDAAAPSRPTGGYLIGMYEELGVAYKDVRMAMAAQPPRDGLMRRPIVIEGWTVGSWQRTLARRSVAVEALLFTTVSRAQTAALRAAAERLGEFLELPVTLEVRRATV